MAHKTVRQRETAIDDRLNNLGVCSLDLGGGDAPAPDPLIGQAAQQNAEVGREYLQWYKAKDAAEAPMRQEATNVALDMARKQIALSDKQLATAAKQEGYADDTRAYELSTFRPLEKKIAADALGYDTAERRDSEASQAQADVGTAADAARGNMIREVQSRGGDVNSGNFTAGLASTGVRETALQASAGNTARKNVEAIGAAKLADAANLGRGIASTNATQTELGLRAAGAGVQSGNSGVNNAQVPGNISAQQTAQYGGAAGTAIQGNSSAGNMMLGQYNATTNATGNNDAAMGAIGKVAGAAIPFLLASDKNIKKDIKKVKPEVSLAAVRKMPGKSWKYKKGSIGDDGGKSHTGPMAQDVQKALGNATAPDGKKIDLISMMGHTVNAVKALDKKVTLSLANAKRPAKA